MSKSTHNLLRQLPSVDVLLAEHTTLIETYGREMTLDAIRDVLEQKRQHILKGINDKIDITTINQQIEAQLANQFAPSLRPVINATGVIIHTNLGRAPPM